MRTPDDYRAEMMANAVELRKAPETFRLLAEKLNKAEDALNLADAVYKDAVDDAFLDAVGSVAERQAIARKVCRDLRDAVSTAAGEVRLVKAELERVELKRKQLDREQMSLQSSLKSIMQEGARVGLMVRAGLVLRWLLIVRVAV